MEPQQYFVDQTTGISYAIEVPEVSHTKDLDTRHGITATATNRDDQHIMGYLRDKIPTNECSLITKDHHLK